MRMIGSALGVAGLFSTLGFVHSIENAFADELSITGGSAEVTRVYRMDSKTCHGGYDADVKGVKAEYNKKFKLFGMKIPTSYSASETYSSSVTNEVCNTGKDGSVTYNKATNKLKVVIPKNALTTVVYQTNPADQSAWASDNGFLMARNKDFDNSIKELPGGLTVHGTDERVSKLRGYALLEAYAVSSESCGQTAWNHLKPIYDSEVKNDLIGYSEIFGAKPLTAADITVESPDEVSFKNQYGDQLQQLTDKLSSSGVTITRVDPASIVCKESPDMKVEQ